jgi:GH15 family glucan-1,4-alpha-glucosidase
MTTTPIADHALLSDRHSAALVDKSGSVVWLCFPRFDSPSVFGALLDRDAGCWSIRPTGVYAVTRRYLDDTLVLETTFHTDSGELVLTDALALRSDGDPHQLGADAPHVLLRTAHCERGRVEVEMQYRPRPEYGLLVPLTTPTPGGVVTRGGTEVLSCTSRCNVRRSASQRHLSGAPGRSPPRSPTP